MATTGHETEIIDVQGLQAALQQYKTNVSDAKADKDSDAVQGNVAMFDSSGNPVDGGTALSTIVSGAAAGATAIQSTDLATVATTGSYNDLSSKPTIPPSMVILKYGSSTWNDFITAYSSNAIVYCRASSNSNPATGSQTRMAFMAYINNETTPTEVEFQYYRSVTTHSDSQQGDQVYIYKLKSTNGGTWENSVRSAFTKVEAGTNMTSSYSSGKITLNNPTTVSTFTNDAGYLVSSDIIDKAEKSEMSVVAGTGANADKTTITLKTGTSATVLTAHQDISGKQNTLVSGTNIKTINNESLLGSGNISVTDTTYSVMGASGSGHASGLTPDTPTTEGNQKFLCENATWTNPFYKTVDLIPVVFGISDLSDNQGTEESCIAYNYTNDVFYYNDVNNNGNWVSFTHPTWNQFIYLVKGGNISYFLKEGNTTTDITSYIDTLNMYYINWIYYDLPGTISQSPFFTFKGFGLGNLSFSDINTTTYTFNILGLPGGVTTTNTLTNISTESRICVAKISSNQSTVNISGVSYNSSTNEVEYGNFTVGCELHVFVLPLVRGSNTLTVVLPSTYPYIICGSTDTLILGADHVAEINFVNGGGYIFVKAIVSGIYYQD